MTGRTAYAVLADICSPARIDEALVLSRVEIAKVGGEVREVLARSSALWRL